MARLTGAGGSSFWPTPTAADAGYFPDLVLSPGVVKLTGPVDISEGSGGQFSIANAARNWTALWMILKACGWKASTATDLSSPPVRATFGHGKGSLTAGLVSNPLFYELVMGWPVGWTDAEARVTGFAAWLQRSRGALSELLLKFEAEPPTGKCN